MVMWMLLVAIAGMTMAALGGALAAAGDQSRQEEEAAARLSRRSREAA